MARNGTLQSIAITGIGMVTPVGHTAYESCASIRAGIVRMIDIDYFIIENDAFEEVPVTGCPICGVTDGHLGLGRWTKMAAMAIQDLMVNAKLSDKDLNTSGLFLGLPSLEREGVDARIADMLALRVGQWTKIEGIANRTRVYTKGHVGLAKALITALGELKVNKVQHAIVGGVDSLVEPETLGFFYREDRLKTEDNTDGFIPGEAAAFMMLENMENAQRRGADIMAILEAPHTATEPITIWSEDPSSEGSGLSQVIRGTFEQLSDKGIHTGLIINDLNGETYRAKEFSNAGTRVLSDIQTEWQLWHPADCIGDTSAASFAVAACVGARSLQKGYAKTENILVCGSSDDGLRGSVYLRQFH